MANELEFKRWFRTRFQGWSETYEPRYGSGLGIPDVQLLIKTEGRVGQHSVSYPSWSLMPVEIKVGWVKNGRLWVKMLRPAQVGWHVRFMRAGGEARIVVGVKNQKGEWVPMVPPWTEASVTGWKEGWELLSCREWQVWA